jgi:hypothetical protein
MPEAVFLEGGRMRRRDFMTLVGSSVVALPLAALAQKAGRTYRLGSLSPHPREIPFNVRFFGGLRRAGFIEGQNLTIDYRAFAPRPDLISQYAAELVIAQRPVRRLPRKRMQRRHCTPRCGSPMGDKRNQMNQEKIRHAAAATDVILEGCNRALQALQAPTWTNGAGC